MVNPQPLSPERTAVRRFLPTRANPAGITDRKIIDAAIEAAIASRK